MSECTEQHNCEKRMDSQATDIKGKVTYRPFIWIAGVLITLGTSLVFGSYGYTFIVDRHVQEVDKQVQKLVTQDDMKDLQRAIVDAIKEK